MNRLVRKQEIIDEEKRLRISELRETGQLVENSKNDVPFGVRAIQSGIQVDGIWISNKNTPVPSELNFEKGGSVSSLTSGGESSKNGNTTSSHASSRARVSTPTQPKGELLSTKTSLSYGFMESAAEVPSLGLQHNNFHQPRRSSGLRYNDNGEYYEPFAASGRSHSQQLPDDQTHPPRFSSMITSRASSTTDNELNSRTSSDTDTIHDRKGKGKAEAFQPVTKDDYFSVPSTDTTDPFATPPQGNSFFSPRSSVLPTRRNSWYDNSTDNLQKSQAHNNIQDIFSSPQERSPFVPGELHQNNVARTINPGFELLPAGTFGNVAGKSRNSRGSIASDKASVESGEKRRNRLQKKR